MYTTLFGLLAATGMRIAEALGLQLDDVTADGLVIRKTKFQKSRLLPLHPTVRQALDRYLIARRMLAPVDRALFVSAAAKPLPYSTVRGVFLHLLDRTGMRGAHSGRDPRIHDLRIPSRSARWSSVVTNGMRSPAMSWRYAPISATRT
jgi:integrase